MRRRRSSVTFSFCRCGSSSAATLAPIVHPWGSGFRNAVRLWRRERALEGSRGSPAYCHNASLSPKLQWKRCDKTGKSTGQVWAQSRAAHRLINAGQLCKVLEVEVEANGICIRVGLRCSTMGHRHPLLGTNKSCSALGSVFAHRGSSQNPTLPCLGDPKCAHACWHLQGMKPGSRASSSPSLASGK